MAWGIKRHTNDELKQRFVDMTVPRDSPILDAAQRFLGDLPFARKGGVFGTCRAKVMGGTVEMRRNYALEPAEIEAGFGADVSALSDR
jgi:ring-1,2-phenylacetyl-CoA epoxidase subunit PaaE